MSCCVLKTLAEAASPASFRLLEICLWDKYRGWRRLSACLPSKTQLLPALQEMKCSLSAPSTSTSDCQWRTSWSSWTCSEFPDLSQFKAHNVIKPPVLGGELKHCFVQLLSKRVSRKSYSKYQSVIFTTEEIFKVCSAGRDRKKKGLDWKKMVPCDLVTEPDRADVIRLQLFSSSGVTVVWPAASHTTLPFTTLKRHVTQLSKPVCQLHQSSTQERLSSSQQSWEKSKRGKKTTKN